MASLYWHIIRRTIWGIVFCSCVWISVFWDYLSSVFQSMGWDLTDYYGRDTAYGLSLRRLWNIG